LKNEIRRGNEKKKLQMSAELFKTEYDTDSTKRTEISGLNLNTNTNTNMNTNERVFEEHSNVQLKKGTDES